MKQPRARHLVDTYWLDAHPVIQGGVPVIRQVFKVIEVRQMHDIFNEDPLRVVCISSVDQDKVPFMYSTVTEFVHQIKHKHLVKLHQLKGVLAVGE